LLEVFMTPLNVAKKAYNHCRYAGNNGDVWKHVLLLEVVRQLSAQRPGSLHYVETHAGPGYARLGENGDWRRGIGRFMDGTAEATDHPYFELALPTMLENRLYKGSWVLTCELLRALSHPSFKITAHEVSAETLKMAGSAIKKGNLSPWVSLRPKSGYDALQKLEGADLIFIDPPYRSSDGTADDWDKVFQAAKRAMDLKTRWIVWYPVFRRDEPDELIRASGGVSFEFSWAPEAPGWVMKGCGMLMDQESADALRYQPGMLAQLAAALGGTHSVHSAATETKPPQELTRLIEATAHLPANADFLGKPV
jgi:23S rRNA (adenine2030-N6)-methyltransferase